jgi:hypothetical protein
MGDDAVNCRCVDIAAILAGFAFLGLLWWSCQRMEQYSDAREAACISKGGTEVQGYDGAVCIKAERIADY